ncbi:hypothetical protein [Thalassospira profundimaris]|uniref:hypothetical protein n=1 Tax=Thalassospira profundimaris TaxID=502049 RepID=UPI0015F0D0FD|nr:hypothetical protein [Thalassospira profundimaris]
MTKDLSRFPYRVVIHGRHSSQNVLNWLDKNIRHDRWTMGIRNIELPRSDMGAPVVDMVIYFKRQDDMELFREKWAGQSRQRRVKLKFLRAALYALLHPRAEMVFYETLEDAHPHRIKPKTRPDDDQTIELAPLPGEPAKPGKAAKDDHP